MIYDLLADCNTNQSNICSKSSVSSLKKELPIRTFLRDFSREVKFDHRLNKHMENYDSHQLERDLESKLEVWNDLFHFMPNEC